MTGQRLVIQPTPNGPQPDLADYNLFSPGGTTALVELLNANGQTIWEGSILVPSGASSLGARVVAVNGPARTAWANAVGALIKVAAEVRFNTGGSTDSGASLTVAPTVTTLGVLSAGETYLIGWVAR